MSDGETAVSWTVSGRVQGVGYRWFVARAAEELRVRGWVRNARDGTVEVMGVGTLEQLSAFESRLWEGPSFSIVDNVEKVSTALEVRDVKSFTIL